jgi:hypothetical protein
MPNAMSGHQPPNGTYDSEEMRATVIEVSMKNAIALISISF